MRPSRSGACRALLALMASAAPATLPRAAAAQGAQNDAPVMRRQELASGVHVISGFANGNVLAVVGAGGVLLVDAQSDRRVALADSVLRTITAAPVRVVISTHYHDDHVAGNPRWRRAGAQLVAHANVPARAARDTVIQTGTGPTGTWHHRAEPPEALPTRTFADTLTLRAGDEEVRVFHVDSAHTDGDAMVWLPRANVLHAGDVVEIGAPPFIDWWAGGRLAGMVRAVDRALALADDRTRIVPGHGPVIDRAALLRYREMLVTVGERVRRAVATGTPLDTAAVLGATAGYEGALGGARYARLFAARVHYGLSRGMR